MTYSLSCVDKDLIVRVIETLLTIEIQALAGNKSVNLGFGAQPRARTCVGMHEVQCEQM